MASFQQDALFLRWPSSAQSGISLPSHRRGTGNRQPRIRRLNPWMYHARKTLTACGGRGGHCCTLTRGKATLLCRYRYRWKAGDRFMKRIAILLLPLALAACGVGPTRPARRGTESKADSTARNTPKRRESSSNPTSLEPLEQSASRMPAMQGIRYHRTLESIVETQASAAGMGGTDHVHRAC